MNNFSRIGLLLTAFYALEIHAQDPRALEIIKTGESKIRGETTQALMKMTISRPEYRRELKVRAWANGETRALVEILEPAKEEGVSSLRLSDQMWNYLPKTDQVVRVPMSLMLQSWMGSDFTNDDLMKASSLPRDYTHRIVGEEKIGKHRTILIECIPKPDAPVVWGKIHYWARKTDSLPVQQKFFDEGGKWVRTLRFAGFRKMDDRIIPTHIRVTKAESPKEWTEVKYTRILYNRQIGSEIFNRESIRKISREGLDLTALWFKQKPGSQTDRRNIAKISRRRGAR